MPGTHVGNTLKENGESPVPPRQAFACGKRLVRMRTHAKRLLPVDGPGNPQYKDESALSMAPPSIDS
jgi:hypothetical protein